MVSLGEEVEGVDLLERVAVLDEALQVAGGLWAYRRPKGDGQSVLISSARSLTWPPCLWLLFG